MRFGSFEIPRGAALAPMAGVTDAAMRSICARYGAVFTVSEMVSAKALTMQDKKSHALLRGRSEGALYGVQLFGYEPDIMGQAAGMIQEEDFDFLDINMGCPAPKIVSHGAGSALLRTPELAGEIARSVVQNSPKPVSAKLRIGWDDSVMNGLEVAKRCEDAGIQMLVVHGRTRAQMYQPGVNQQAVAEIKQAVSIPVLYNGDVQDAASALQALENTGCDSVAVGRAASGQPWVFREIAAALNGQPIPPPPTLRERMALLDEQVQAMCNRMGEANAMRASRGVASAYVKGLRGAASLRNQAHALTYYTDLALLVANVYDANRGYIE